MKMETKKLMTIILVVLLGVSIAFNIYTFAWKTIEDRIYRRGIDDAIKVVLLQLQEKREVVINTPNGPIVLVPKEANIRNQSIEKGNNK